MSIRLQVKSVVRGYHIYKDEWDPSIGGSFGSKIDENNRYDRFAVAVIVNDNTVGHVPKEISKIVYYFIRNNGAVTGTVDGRTKRSSVQDKRLELSCTYHFSAGPRTIRKLRRLLHGINREIVSIM